MENNPTNISRIKSLRRGLTWYISYLQRLEKQQILDDPDVIDKEELQTEVDNCLEILAESEDLFLQLIKEGHETEMFWKENVDNIFKRSD